MMRCCRGRTEKWEPSDEDMLFPMWLVPIKVLLQMAPGPPPSFQELQEQGLLVKWRKGMYVVFVSHQWLGWKHADPTGHHVGCLREILQSVLNGRLRLMSDVKSLFAGKVAEFKQSDVAKLQDAYIWFDWFSIPQITVRREGDDPDMGSDVKKAVDSIPAYAEASDMFVILAPSAEHQDTKAVCNYSTWMCRGWCLMEQFSVGLGRREGQTVVQIASANYAFLDMYSTTSVGMVDGPGNANFTVESDRPVVKELVRSMVDRHLAPLWDEDISRARHVEAIRNVWQGDPRPYETESVEEFLSRFRFKSLLDTDPRGSGPVCCAAVTGNHVVLKELARRGCSMETRYYDKEAPWLTPLMALVIACDDVPTLRLLIELGAKMDAQNSLGGNPLCLCVYSNRIECTKILLQQKADPNVEMMLKYTILQGVPLVQPRTEAAKLLIEAGARVNAMNGLGLTALHSAVMVQNRGHAEVLLEHNADVNATVAPTFAGRMVLKLMALAHTSCGPVKLLKKLQGMTPLAIAAFNQDAPTFKLLRAHGADMSIKNAAGEDVHDILRAVTSRSLSFSLDAFQEEERKDSPDACFQI